MTEKNDLRAMRADAPLPDSKRLISQRLALMTAINEQDGEQSAAPARAWLPRRRLIVGAATVGAFAVAGGVLVSLPDSSAGKATASAQGTAGGPQLLSAQASADTLELAAATVEKTSSHVPGAKQWVYEKSMISRTGSKPETAETWERWDGSGTATLVPGGKLQVEYVPNQEEIWKKEGFDDRTQREFYAFLATLPSDPDLVMKLIREKHAIRKDPGETQAQHDWAEIDVLYDSVLVPPKAQAGLFRALAKIPGARVEKGIKDPAGRPVIGVTVNYPKLTATGMVGKQEIWFDAKTYAFRGEVRHDSPAKLPKGSPPPAITVVRLASGVVDKPGQRP